jgi:hypothetical protein
MINFEIGSNQHPFRSWLKAGERCSARSSMTQLPVWEER